MQRSRNSRTTSLIFLRSGPSGSWRRKLRRLTACLRCPRRICITPASLQNDALAAVQGLHGVQGSRAPATSSAPMRRVFTLF